MTNVRKCTGVRGACVGAEDVVRAGGASSCVTSFTVTVRGALACGLCLLEGPVVSGWQKNCVNMSVIACSCPGRM